MQEIFNSFIIVNKKFPNTEIKFKKLLDNYRLWNYNNDIKSRLRKFCDRRDTMYGNLSTELKRKNIASKVVAGLLDCTEKTANNKICGVTDFTITEAFAIHKNLLPEFDIDYLFTRTA